MNSIQRMARAIVCLLCLLFLLFDTTSLPTFGASQQVCLPGAQGQPTTPPEQAGIILINEVLLSSKQAWSCPGSTSVPDSSNKSWLELYNPRALSFNLYIVHAVIDGGPGTAAIYLPFGSTIAAHGFLTIFPDKSLVLTNGGAETFTRRLLFSGTVIDQVTIPANLGNGQSYARIPDGASKWKITNAPTIGSSNVLPTATPAVKHTLKSSTTKKKSSGVTTSTKASRSTTATTTTSIYTSTADTTIPGENNNAPVANGVQPAWRQLQLPATPSSLPTSQPRDTVSPIDTTRSPAPANNTNADVLRNVLFTALALVLIGVLFWCWRRFMRS